MSDSKTILVIDDEVRICQSFERALTKEGYNVMAFSDSNKALQQLKAGGVDLVVSDLMMPEKSGLDVLKEMRESGVETNLVMITGYASIQNALETMRFGAVDYLPKPFTVAELKGVVARGLKANEVNSSEFPSAPEGTYEIHNHSWARKDDSGEVLVGVHPFVLQCCGAITEFELPMEEDELIQGGAFGKLIADDSNVPIRLWSPVSGDVKITNVAAMEDPSVVEQDPYGDGWLLRMRPSNLEDDLNALTAMS